MPAEASHLLIAQDDIVVCRDFVPTVLKVIAARADNPVSLFMPGIGLQAIAVGDACRRGEHWCRVPHQEWIPAVCLALPRAHVEAILAFADRQGITDAWRGDDSILGEWMRADSIDAWATVPSLCDHPDDVPSLVGGTHYAGANPQRVAVCWTGPEWSPLEIQW